MLMNGMARAMGQPDIYPFVPAHQVLAKLQFTHLVVSEERHRDDADAPAGAVQSQSGQVDHSPGRPRLPSGAQKFQVFCEPRCAQPVVCFST